MTDGRSGRRKVSAIEHEIRREKQRGTRLAERAHRRALAAERAEERQKARRAQVARVARLRATLRRLARRSLVRLRLRQAEERRRVLAELRERFARERAELRQHWAERRAAVALLNLSKRERARAIARIRREELKARKNQEKAHRRLHADETRAAAARRASERRRESDDEVRAAIEVEHPEMLALWERVKGRIRASGHMTRREAFLHYVHENPHEVIEALEDGAEDWIREQVEAEERRYREKLPEAFAEVVPLRPKRAARVTRAKPAGFRRKRLNRHETAVYLGPEAVGVISKRGPGVWEFIGPHVGQLVEYSQKALLEDVRQRILANEDDPARPLLAPSPSVRKAKRRETTAERRARLEAAPF